MNNQIFFLIIIILILIFLLFGGQSGIKNRINNRYSRRQNRRQNIRNDMNDQNDQNDQNNQNNQNDQNNQNNQNDQNNQNNQNNQNVQQIPNSKQNKSSNVINEYLGETKCEESFNTMGTEMNIGNNMKFLQQIGNPTQLDRSLEKSLVPDFEPNSLNINPDLNSYGYATSNSSDNNFYVNRGYLKPKNASQYANTIQYDLSHPYQTRYCDSQK